jgi:hypothetical protein
MKITRRLNSDGSGGTNSRRRAEVQVALYTQIIADNKKERASDCQNDGCKQVVRLKTRGMFLIDPFSGSGKARRSRNRMRYRLGGRGGGGKAFVHCNILSANESPGSANSFCVLL